MLPWVHPEEWSEASARSLSEPAHGEPSERDRDRGSGHRGIEASRAQQDGHEGDFEDHGQNIDWRACYRLPESKAMKLQ
jgi:hypothetical protein